MTPNLHDPVAFERLARPFAVGIRAKSVLLDSDELTRPQRSAVLSSITQDLRKLCDALVPDLLPPVVSARARERAEPLGVDLRRCGWHDQKKFDRDRSTFHLEHCDTVMSIRAACVAATDVDSVVTVLAHRLAVAWVLKEEDAELSRLGFKSVRQDWRAAYAAAGIHLLASD